MNKALIIRLSSVGDIILSSLLVRAFRTRFPDCQLDFVVKEEFADLVRHNPNIAHIITFPRNGTFSDLKFLQRSINRTGYDIIIDIHDSLRSRFLSLGSRHVVRMYKRKFARFLLVNFKINIYPSVGGAPSVALRYLEPVTKLGVQDDGKGLELFFDDAASSNVRSLLADAGFTGQQMFIGVCPFAKHNNKMWLKDRFAEAAATLSRQHSLPVVIFGSNEEADRSTEIMNLIHQQNSSASVLNLAGRLSLIETAAMLDHCSLVLTNDTGLMHIASARKCTVAAIFGPTVKEFGFLPFGTESRVIENHGLPCRPCTHIGLPECPQGHFKCMSDISTASVLAAANDLLGKT